MEKPVGQITCWLDDKAPLHGQCRPWAVVRIAPGVHEIVCHFEFLWAAGSTGARRKAQGVLAAPERSLAGRGGVCLGYSPARPTCADGRPRASDLTFNCPQPHATLLALAPHLGVRTP